MEALNEVAVENANTLPIGDSVLASWIRSISVTARGYGVDPEPILIKSGLPLNLLTVPDARYSAVCIRRFWDLMVSEVSDSLFGLRCGQEMQVSALHGLGLAMITSSSLAHLLDLITRYRKVISTTMDIALVHRKGSTQLKVKTLHGKEKQCSAQQVLLALIARQASSLSQRKVVPKAVYLPNINELDAKDIERVQEHFGCEVKVSDGQTSGIEFAYPDLIEPYAGANSQLREANEDVVKRYLERVHRSSYTIRVEEEIKNLLELSEKVSVEKVSDVLALSPRTLQRRLIDEGITFSEVFDRYRKQLAHNKLAHTSESITEIAFDTGFSDLSNFSRKCYTWFGTSPAAYRKRIQMRQS